MKSTAPCEEIEAEAPPEALARLLERLAACWTALGEEAPHWSVLPLPQHRPENLEAHREGFYQTGLFDLGSRFGQRLDPHRRLHLAKIARAVGKHA